MRVDWGAHYTQANVLRTGACSVVSVFLICTLAGCFFRVTPFDFPTYPADATFVAAIEGYQPQLAMQTYNMSTRELRERYANQSLVVQGSYLYAAQCGLTIFDISQPDEISVVGNFEDGCGVDDLAVVGGRAFLAARDRGLTVVDVRDPRRPKVVDTFDYRTDVNAPPFAVMVQDAYIYLYTPLAMIDACHVSKPKAECETYKGWHLEKPLWQVFQMQTTGDNLQLLHLRSIEGIGYPRAALGDIIYTATPWQTGPYTRRNYLQIVSIEDRQQPEVIDSQIVDTHDLKAFGNTLFGTVGMGLRAWDISDPQQLMELSTTYEQSGRIGDFETFDLDASRIIGEGYSLAYQRHPSSVEFKLLARITKPEEIHNCRVSTNPGVQCQLQLLGKTRQSVGAGACVLGDEHIYCPLGIGTQSNRAADFVLVELAILVYQLPK